MNIKNLISGITVLTVLAFSGAANAVPITFTQQFDGGFNLSINGGQPAASGPITITGIVDSAAVDIDASGLGEYQLDSVTFTGAGFTNELVTTDLGLLIWGTDKFAFQLLGMFNQGITGWNGTTSAGDFIGDVNDLSTLGALPYTTTGQSTFWLSPAWTLASGDTITGDIGAGGPTGTFSINMGSVDVPEPGTIALLSIGLAGIGFGRRK